MKKIIIASLIFLAGIFCTAVLAQTTSTSTVDELIQTLQQQIATLKSQIDAMNQQIAALKQTKGEIMTTLQLIRQLRVGMSGDDVKTLQEALATDCEIYPEGLVTGYFGSLTEKAVKKFQEKLNLDQTGNVGPQTLAKINELLKVGAGKSGKVPPGLLIAPGIRKKLGFQPQPLPGQVLPPGICKKLGSATSTPDTTPPVISSVEATSTLATSTTITWLTNENAMSEVWYDIVTPVVMATSTPFVSSSDLVLSHSIILPDLTASTTYYYFVSSTDGAGNTATSTESSFTTLGQE